MLLASALLIAVLMDSAFGEPRKYHPLVGFGNIAAFAERMFNRGPGWFARILGIIAWLGLLAPLSGATILLIGLPNGWLWLYCVLALYFSIAYRSLSQHIHAIYRPLKQQDIKRARQALAKIVSRDTEGLDAQAVRKAAIESCLENGSDGVLAPLFWFAFLGPVGAVVYRLINTLDAMWGYKNARFLYFGWFAARMDDLANWVPARLVAVSYCLLGNTELGVKAWRSQGHLCKSPNAGPVMSAGAGALDVGLGGVAHYHGQAVYKPALGTGNSATNEDLLRALRLVRNTLFLWVMFGMVIAAGVETAVRAL